MIFAELLAENVNIVPTNDLLEALAASDSRL